mgnify:CR=1 FL=1
MFSSWASSLQEAKASLQEASSVAAASLQQASSAAAGAASRLAKTVEAELKEEYAATMAPAPPPPLPPLDAELGEKTSALERVAQVGAKLFSPVEDAGGTAAEPVASGRIVMLPWEQPGLSEGTRSRMRALSQERSIFLAPPVAGCSSFRFDLQLSLSLVLEALRVDKHLDEQRHQLVPKQVSEEEFFTNYFHHLHVLARGGGVPSHVDATDGSRGGSDGSRRSPTSSSPVLVSAAASDASDLTGMGDDVAEASGALGGSLATPQQKNSTLGLLSSPTASKTLSVEEQFECVRCASVGVPVVR